MSEKPRRVRKAVLPAAGLGTRFLPATKAQPKEMLPVVDKPLIQYVVEECVTSGIDNIIIVTGRGKNAIEDHFDSSPELEHFLESKGKHELAALVHDIGNMVTFSYTRQKEPLGLGHAVLVAKELVGNEPFAVLLGDVIIPDAHPATQQLVEIYEATGKGAIAVEEVPRAKTGLYGIVDVEPAAASSPNKRLLKIRDLVEVATASGRRPFQPRGDRALSSSAGSIRLPGADQTRTRRGDSTYRCPSPAGRGIRLVRVRI